MTEDESLGIVEREFPPVFLDAWNRRATRFQTTFWARPHTYFLGPSELEQIALGLRGLCRLLGRMAKRSSAACPTAAACATTTRTAGRAMRRSNYSARRVRSRSDAAAGSCRFKARRRARGIWTDAIQVHRGAHRSASAVDRGRHRSTPPANCRRALRREVLTAQRRALPMYLMAFWLYASASSGVA
jgi:hypothetical protein